MHLSASAPYRVLNPPHPQPIGAVVQHVEDQLELVDLVGLWGVGRTAGVRAFRALRIVAGHQPILVVDPPPGPSGLWEKMQGDRGGWSAKQLEQVEWELIVGKAPTVCLVTDDPIPEVDPTSEGIRINPGGGRCYVFGAANYQSVATAETSR